MHQPGNLCCRCSVTSEIQHLKLNGQAAEVLPFVQISTDAAADTARKKATGGHAADEHRHIDRFNG